MKSAFCQSLWHVDTAYQFCGTISGIQATENGTIFRLLPIPRKRPDTVAEFVFAISMQDSAIRSAMKAQGRTQLGFEFGNGIRPFC